MLDTHSILEVPPQKEGRQLYAIIAPDPVKIKDIKKRIEKEKKELAKAAAAVDKKPEEETTAEG
jgi:hypothetical protein